MATCDPQALLNSANCFDCLSDLQLEQVQVQMLCDLVNVGLAGGPFVRISGDTMTGALGIGYDYLTAPALGLAVSGFVGIGTATPADPLEVNAGALFVSGIRVSGSNYPTIRCVSSSAINGGQFVMQNAVRTWTFYGQATDLILHDGVDNRVKFAAGGKIGFGTLAPKSLLDIVGNLTVGDTYGGVNAAPTSGAIFEGRVGIGTNAPNANAILDLTSTVYPFLPPRMTTAQRNAVAGLTAGMTIYNITTDQREHVNNALAWVAG